ncbi:hypothetical protein M5D96_012442 [Drosophila gunungcola]|uniref:Uncharacterized protein n=1 Tax=Drosophila gunungcola TaxID=103775 RepID=A0A9P9YDZ8_9MUSC|nr:hypothetical protein M5D96_012442 [Drosophila gunungcola]
MYPLSCCWMSTMVRVCGCAVRRLCARVWHSLLIQSASRQQLSERKRKRGREKER